MKKFLWMVLAFFCIILLTWCTTTWVKTTVDWWVNTLVQKDQEKQQGFVLTKELLYDEYDQDNQEIMLSDIWLVAIPDFCTLLNPADQSKLKNISLANNDIKYAAQDLSCLTWLERLNLAYNNIETIWNLWELPALRELLLQKNEIAAIQSFPNLPSLETLNLSYNKLKELSNLWNLKNRFRDTVHSYASWKLVVFNLNDVGMEYESRNYCGRNIGTDGDSNFIFSNDFLKQVLVHELLSNKVSHFIEE